MADKYGIPEGGNNGAWGVKYWKNNQYILPWSELLASIALGGWPREHWGMAAAVAAAESSRKPFIYNTYKKGHFGLFQISRSAHPQYFNESTDGGMRWIAPWYNANMGYQIFKSQGWGAWEAKTNGAYLAYYPQAMTAAADLSRKTGLHGGDEKGYWQSLISKRTHAHLINALDGAAGLADLANSTVGGAVADAGAAAGQGVVDSGTAVAQAVGDSFGWMTDAWELLTTPAVWMRAAYGITGVALVAGGLFLIVRNTPGGKAAGTAVKGAAAAVTRPAKTVKTTVRSAA